MNICIIGNGGHGRVVKDAAELLNFEDIRVFDDALPGAEIDKIPSDSSRICAIGDNKVRKGIVSKIDTLYPTGVDGGWKTIFHPTAIVAATSKIGSGCYIGAGAVVQPYATIGDHTIINTNAVVEHDCKIGSFTHVAPNTTICGTVSVGDEVLIGAGSVIIPKINIGNNVTIGAGSSVVRDVATDTLAYGCPARKRSPVSQIVKKVEETIESSDSCAVFKRIISGMEGHTFHHHVHILYDLRTVLGKPECCYMEIGSFCGASASLILQHPQPTQVYCVDPLNLPWQDPQERILKSNLEKFKGKNQYEIFQHYSTDPSLLSTLKERGIRVDILLIDGGHEYIDVINDFYNFQEFVNEGGFIVFDDYLDSEYNPMVKKAVDKIVEDIHSHNLPYHVIGSLKNYQNAFFTSHSHRDHLNEFIIYKTKIYNPESEPPRKSCFIVKNFYNFDPVVEPPENLPRSLVPVYLTDNLENAEEAKRKGWEEAHVVEEYLDVSDPFERRCVVALANCYPEKMAPELKKYEKVFMCDANVRKLDTNYGEFTDDSPLDCAFYATSGWYKGPENTITSEMQRSMNSTRWSYNFEDMHKNFTRYLIELPEMGIDPKDCPVVSAKYIGWNLHHPDKETVAEYAYNEYKKHLQGNVIFSMALKHFPELVYHYTGFKNDGLAVYHQINAY